MKKILTYLLIFSLQIAYSQNVIKHKVAKGETIPQIAKKYNVTPAEIYKLNPDAQSGVSENTIIVVPKKVTDKKVVVVNKTHTVGEKETLYAISKQYGVTIPEIEQANPDVKNGLKIGQVLTIPVKKDSVSASKLVQPKKETQPKKELQPKKEAQQKLPIFHTVLAKETKYGITKQYGITIEELEKKNPEIVGKELPLGFELLIKGERPKVTTPPVVQPKQEVTEPKVTSTPATSDVKSQDGYLVKPQETIYSITKQFNCTEEELLALNPELKDGLKEGMMLKVPTRKASAKPLPQKDLTDLAKSIKQSNKKVAILLPFNLSKMDQDTVNSTKARLQKDKFLNMTLDYYSGALIAIDSIKKLGSKIEITILDSEETKSSSNVTNLIERNNLKSFDAVIGPFYQNNVEKAAELLPNVPVISPLSKDYDKKYPNLYQATPSADDTKKAMFDFMIGKEGNILAIIDPKKQSIKQYITENYPDTQLVNLAENGTLDVAHLKSLLVAGKTNFVLMETEKTNLILSITSNLVTLQKQFDIRLVILAENESLEYEEIPLSRLTKLKLTYPSQTRENASPEAANFERNYRKQNKIYPNYFATRGFDVTFDVLTRLSQEKSFSDSVSQDVTQQVENKFYYVPTPEGGFANKGVYILYYDTDLTIKQEN